jgi:8-oxo-dGTP pyrophosphatase MutT (NUDIX family)
MSGDARAGRLLRVTVWVDPPTWPAHGTLWSHVISDTSLEELHDFAQRAGIPPRSFEGDHYDVPAQRYDDVVVAGAHATDGRDLARRLARSGLRFRKRKGERPLGRYADALVAVGAPHTLDVIASPLEPPERSGAAVVLVSDGTRMVLVLNDSPQGWSPPGGKRERPEPIRTTAVRELAEETGLFAAQDALTPVGYERIIVAPGRARGIWSDREPNHIAVFAAPVRPAEPVAPQADDVLEARWVTFSDARAQCGHQPWWLLVQGWIDAICP